MKILVTGATGFIGSRLIRHLGPRHEVLALARHIPDGPAPPGVQWIEQDLAAPLDGRTLPDHVDAVIHLAQSQLYKEFPRHAQDIFDVNIAGTFHLLDYARQAGAGQFIFASSGGVYGYSYERFVEHDPVYPLNFYLSSKYSAELLIANYQPFFRTVVFRFFFVYGPDQTRMLIPTLINRVLRGDTITIEGNPGLRINPTYVDDLVRVFEPALALPGSDLFNVAGEETVTITELVRLIEQVTGKTAQIVYQEAGSTGDLVGDNTRLKTILGVTPQTALRAGLAQMVSAMTAIPHKRNPSL